MDRAARQLIDWEARRVRNLEGVRRRQREARAAMLVGCRPPLAPGRCDLCHEPTDTLDWDHDHDLEELGFSSAETHRGWICRKCNLDLGRFCSDNLSGAIRVGWLDAIIYLENARA